MGVWSRDMSNDLVRMLAELRSDHPNMAVMLDLLETEARIGAGSAANPCCLFSIFIRDL